MRLSMNLVLYASFTMVSKADQYMYVLMIEMIEETIHLVIELK